MEIFVSWIISEKYSKMMGRVSIFIDSIRKSSYYQHANTDTLIFIPVLVDGEAYELAPDLKVSKMRSPSPGVLIQFRINTEKWLLLENDERLKYTYECFVLAVKGYASIKKRPDFDLNLVFDIIDNAFDAAKIVS